MATQKRTKTVMKRHVGALGLGTLEEQRESEYSSDDREWEAGQANTTAPLLGVDDEGIRMMIRSQNGIMWRQDVVHLLIHFILIAEGCFPEGLDNRAQVNQPG